MKYLTEMKKLENNREELLTFYTFPAAHWAAIRTINLIKSTFMTLGYEADTRRSLVQKQPF
ncbi:MAG: hypothetical protein ACTS85_04030 [Arsenophonus sp. NC-PG7-MAG3]